MSSNCFLLFNDLIVACVSWMIPLSVSQEHSVFQNWRKLKKQNWLFTSRKDRRKSAVCRCFPTTVSLAFTLHFMDCNWSDLRLATCSFFSCWLRICNSVDERLFSLLRFSRFLKQQTFAVIRELNSHSFTHCFSSVPRIPVSLELFHCFSGTTISFKQSPSESDQKTAAQTRGKRKFFQHVCWQNIFRPIYQFE